jgi:hypothetical protein
MEQISLDIIERSVQSVGSGWQTISTFALKFIVKLRCLFLFEVNQITLKIK